MFNIDIFSWELDRKLYYSNTKEVKIYHDKCVEIIYYVNGHPHDYRILNNYFICG